MMRSSGYNRFGVLMGTSWRASCPRSHRLEGDFSPMITLILFTACLLRYCGYPIPLSLRSFYILALYQQAIRAYKPYVYPGRILLLQSTEKTSEPQARWEAPGAGGVESHVVPGDHQTILHEPQIKVWATLLGLQLEKLLCG